jgi:hypothetical protein
MHLERQGFEVQMVPQTCEATTGTSPVHPVTLQSKSHNALSKITVTKIRNDQHDS